MIRVPGWSLNAVGAWWETAQLTLGVAPEAQAPAGSLVCSYSIPASPLMKAHPFARAAVTQSHALSLDSRTSPARGSGGWKSGPRCGQGRSLPRAVRGNLPRPLSWARRFRFLPVSSRCPHSECVSVSKSSFLIRAPVILY